MHRAIASGNLGDVRRHADEKTVKVLDHGGRNALHRAVLFERRFIVNELLKNYSKYLINGTDAVSSEVVYAMVIFRRVTLLFYTRRVQPINQSVNFYSGLSDRSHFEDH